MSYFKLLGLEREPFSTSPDPQFFFLSAAHRAALYRLRISVKLQRGLCLLLGDVGTGKTTLSRRLAQVLPQDGPIDLHVLLNPYVTSEEQFLLALMEMFHLEMPASPSVRTMLGAIERHLFARGIEKGRIVTLIIDEAQQLPLAALELLRGLLNYETQDVKLLQLILLAQTDFLPTLRGIRNLWDRMSLRYVLNPLDERETKELIREIYYATQGYPRRIALLCHDALERLVMDNQPTVLADLIRRLAGRERELQGAALAV